MGRIRVLSETLASQVAAGEVVERPASVVKELMENSIDAGAKRITVEFHKGGTRLIRITDDGIGMDHSDALLCIERHATSKIRVSSDLESIKTLGFRGEALPSIASISRFKLTTRQASEDVGATVEITGGRLIDTKDSGGPTGTCIEVADLFFNVPARRKFLSGEQTEASHILKQVETLAIAHPEIAFTCRRDEKDVIKLAATNDLAVRLTDLHGRDFLQKFVKVPEQENQGIKVRGWIARPGEGRSDKTHQVLFVNGRMIRSQALSLPLREACEGVLAKGLHPPAILFFDIDPTAVDCNVHPAKLEVRFKNPEIIRAVALQAARSAWQTASPTPNNSTTTSTNTIRNTDGIQTNPPTEEDPTQPKQDATIRIPDRPNAISLLPLSIQTEFQQPKETNQNTNANSQNPQTEQAHIAQTPTKQNTENKTTEETTTPVVAPYSTTYKKEEGNGFKSRELTYIGYLDKKYIIFEEQQSLLLVEIKAARERILYEQFLARLGDDTKTGQLEGQGLLVPEVMDTSPAEIAWIEANKVLLQTAGLTVEPFGANSVKVESVPAYATQLPIKELVHNLIDEIREAEGSMPKDSQINKATREKLASSVSRLAANGARPPTGEEGAQMLLKELLACNLPYATPKGRPTMSQLSPGELQRRFKA